MKPGQQRHFQIRAAVRKAGVVTGWCLGVPNWLAQVVPPGTQFVPELTKDGILYRLVDRVPPLVLPAWAAQPTPEEKT